MNVDTAPWGTTTLALHMERGGVVHVYTRTPACKPTFMHARAHTHTHTHTHTYIVYPRAVAGLMLGA
jgi:hypothetical protein